MYDDDDLNEYQLSELENEDLVEIIRKKKAIEKCNKESEAKINEALDLWNHLDNRTLNKDLGDLTLNEICAYFLDEKVRIEKLLKDLDKMIKRKKEIKKENK